MYIALDVQASSSIVDIISKMDDVYFTTQIRKLEV